MRRQNDRSESADFTVREWSTALEQHLPRHQKRLALKTVIERAVRGLGQG